MSQKKPATPPCFHAQEANASITVREKSSAGQEVKPPSNICQEPARCPALCGRLGNRAGPGLLILGPYKLMGKTEMSCFEGAKACVQGMETQGRALDGGSRTASSSRMPEPSLQDGQELTRERECREKAFSGKRHKEVFLKISAVLTSGPLPPPSLALRRGVKIRAWVVWSLKDQSLSLTAGSPLPEGCDQLQQLCSWKNKKIGRASCRERV